MQELYLSTATNPFGAPRRMRNIIGTEDGCLVNLDWKSQEGAVQAFMSGDPQMIAAVKSGDPYLATAKFVDAIPKDAERKDYEKEREIYKTSFLAIGYDQTAWGLKEKLNNTFSQATYILNRVKKLYKVYFAWSKALKDRAMAQSFYETKYGWKYHIGSEEKINTSCKRFYGVR